MSRRDVERSAPIRSGIWGLLRTESNKCCTLREPGHGIHRMCANRESATLVHMTAACSPQLCVHRLLIADDRSRTRRALRAVLATQPGIELIGEAVDGEEALVEIERLRPDIVILDIRMPRLDGIAATRQIKTRWPETRVIA